MPSAATFPRLWSLLIRANTRLERILKPIAKRYDLTVSQLKILYFTYISPRKTVGKIANMTGIAKTNTSAICKTLAKSGYIRHRKNDEDSRVVELELTERGISAAECVASTLSGTEDEIANTIRHLFFENI